ncbi:MAG: alpha/beta hydrolase [Lachnospiraceae bacterium]|nr:alpha/beta hydrolase [Lachnospiraceae bacterium]
MDGQINAEQNYRKYMEEQILPAILPRREELYLSREPGRKLYCAFYTADETVPAKGILLISHGFTETADKYFEVICYFLKAGFHVCIPEHCGHGRSYRLVNGVSSPAHTVPAAHRKKSGEIAACEGDLSLVHVDSWKRYIADLRFIAQAAKKYYAQKSILSSASLPLFLFAHSMGGGIGAALVARDPGLFERVILCSPMICPATGGVPMPVTQLIDAALCASGHECEYVIGQHAYNRKETFDEAFATSHARWAWYKAKTDAKPLFQTSGASYGWLREAIRLNHFLMTVAWKQITVPILLFQAENETVVSREQQVMFLQKLAQARQSSKTVCQPPVFQKQNLQNRFSRDPVSSKAFSSFAASSKSPILWPNDIRFVRIPGAKHEIYRSEDETTTRFLKECLEFLLAEI